MENKILGCFYFKTPIVVTFKTQNRSLSADFQTLYRKAYSTTQAELEQWLCCVAALGYPSGGRQKEHLQKSDPVWKSARAPLKVCKYSSKSNFYPIPGY